jgi:hypothetical protein
LKEQLLNFLSQNQNPDGGWGYFPRKQSALEPTTYVVMALKQSRGQDEVLRKALDFVRSSQTADGGWPVNTTDTETAVWVSPLVGLAVLTVLGFGSSCQSAFAFVLKTFGKMPKNWLPRLSEWLGYGNPANVNTNLGGWAWNPGTATWVEPTCYALLFLKRLRGKIQGQKVEGTIAEAESMIYNRMCKSGGWNYGNARVLGEELRPYPLTTSLALIALQEHSSRTENQESLAYLKHAILFEKSALSLCFAGLCLDIYSQEWQTVSKQLGDLYQETEFMQGIKTSALALLVLEARQGRNIFRHGICPDMTDHA